MQGIYFVSFGPKGSACGDMRVMHGEEGKEDAGGGGGGEERGGEGEEGKEDGASMEDGRHVRLLEVLHSYGGALLSALPPSGWMVLALPEAAERMAAEDGVCVVSAFG